MEEITLYGHEDLPLEDKPLEENDIYKGAHPLANIEECAMINKDMTENNTDANTDANTGVDEGNNEVHKPCRSHGLETILTMLQIAKHGINNLIKGEA